MKTTSSAQILALIGAFTLLIVCAVIFYFDPTVLRFGVGPDNDVPAAVGSVDQFTDTQIVAHPDAALEPNKNIIWCGTMALAWNEAISVLKGPLSFTPPIPVADELNRQEFTKSDLDTESYVVMAGYKLDHIDDKFRSELIRKFGDSANPPTLDAADSPATPGDIAIYAYLLKNLSFTTPFDKNEPLFFEGHQVASFGFGYESHLSYEAPSYLTSEVSMLSYVSEDNFAIQLKLKDDNDQLILAKIPPGKTLQATIDSVMPEITANPVWGIYEKDALAIPKIDFDLIAHFKKLEHQQMPTGNLNTVAENIVFRLNEKGVELKAFTTISATLAAVYPTPQPINLVFDKPFLVLLKRTTSSRPYFAMWVGNPTLLVSP